MRDGIEFNCVLISWTMDIEDESRYSPWKYGIDSETL